MYRHDLKTCPDVTLWKWIYFKLFSHPVHANVRCILLIKEIKKRTVSSDAFNIFNLSVSSDFEHIVNTILYNGCVWVCEINTPVRSKVKMSPSHLAALLGVLGSELQLDKRRLFLLGELGSSTESKSKRERQRVHKTERLTRGRENLKNVWKQSKRRNCTICQT